MELRPRKTHRVLDTPLKNGAGLDDSAIRKVCYSKIHPIEGELGFFHWFIVLVLVATIYGLIVWQDSRMPSVTPGKQHQNFSEERARVMLNRLAELGPRPGGSTACEIDAFQLITEKLKELLKVFDSKSINRLDLDVQRPVGCFDLKFLSAFSSCYYQPTNIIARIGPRQGPSKHSVLVNCHFDTLPDTPGATDDAVSCAIMLELIEVLSYSSHPLENDIIFLFNGAEESFLQASHGFISSHKWRHNIRAFINLEGAGSGGRELLFQAGPGESWLIKTYLDNAPFPHANVLAQEIFQSGIIPSDTDFRVFRDYGRISGLDIAYIRNGWVYHTEFDKPELITRGSIQRSGDNILAVLKALIRSPYLEQPANFNEGNKWVFYDLVGLFPVFYSVETGIIVNYAAVIFTFVLIFRRISKGVYKFSDLGVAFIQNIQTLTIMLFTGALIFAIIWLFDLTMAWYSTPELVFLIYIWPMWNAAIWVHLKASNNKMGLSAVQSETIHYDLTLILCSILLLALTAANFASSSIVLCYVLFPSLRDPIIYLLGKLGLLKQVSPKALFYCQTFCSIPTIIYCISVAMLTFEFFVPLMGRFGNTINPEFVMMTLSLVVAYVLTLFTNNLIYISRRIDFLHKYLVLFSVLGLVIVFTTRVGNPYKFSEDAPRTRRIIALHTRRTIYDFGGAVKNDTALFVQTMDYRGIADLPEHIFLQAANRPDCSQTMDEYCQMPYYIAVHELLPPKEALWVPIPATPYIHKPLTVQLISKNRPRPNQLNLTLSITGGADKMSLHITPLNGFQFKRWSLTNFDTSRFKPRKTYFVFMTYGHQAPDNRTFSLLLENPNITDPNSEITLPSLEFAVATHYAHGEYQNSDALTQLRSIIKSRRQMPHAAVGNWKWAISMIGAVAEIIVHFF